jgi:hypothetical protein
MHIQSVLAREAGATERALAALSAQGFLSGTTD